LIHFYKRILHSKYLPDLKKLISITPPSPSQLH